MQDQGKRLMIAVVLALGVMLVYSKLFPGEPDKPKAGSGSASGVTASSERPFYPEIGPAPGSAPAPSPATSAPLTLKFGQLEATFSSACGGLVGWRLTDPRYARDATKGELLPTRDQMVMVDAGGKHVPVPAAQLTELPACGAFDVDFMRGSTLQLPRAAVWKQEQPSPTEVRYSYHSDQLDVVKAFTVMPDKYLVRMVVQVTARPAAGEALQQLVVSAYAFQDPAVLESGSSRVEPRAWGSSTMRGGEIVHTDVAAVQAWPRLEPQPTSDHRTIQWTGFEHPYLLAGYAPLQRDGDHVAKHTRAADGRGGLPRGFMQTAMVFPAETFKPGDAPKSREVVAYLGPKNHDDLQQADAAAGFTTGFNHVVDLGWFAFIGRPLLWLLQRFHQAFGNWGIAIILLTFLVKALTLYWTTKSMRSMKAMAALAPQMKALQTKYADDKQRQQTETMALYKEHGVNPVAGCLPILLQMPIWLALYRMLSNAGELYQQVFIPGWIDDLTATDPLHILPVVLVVTMFVQARLQPANADSTQQKFLQYGMPLMFGVMSFFFPAGLTLYIFTNTILSALHSIYMNKFDKQSLAMAAQLKKNQEAAAAGVAKAAGGAGKAAGGAGKAAGGAGKGSANGKAAPVKRVIEVEATETAPDGDGADDDGDGPADAPEVDATAGPARSRPRRKKRRR